MKFGRFPPAPTDTWRKTAACKLFYVFTMNIEQEEGKGKKRMNSKIIIITSFIIPYCYHSVFMYNG